MRLFNILETSYENFDSTIRTFLSKTFGDLGQYYSKSNIFGVIFEGVKGVVQNLMFYIEDALTEQNSETAIRKKSLVSLAKVSGYEAFFGHPASGTITISNNVSNGLDSGSTMLYINDGTTIVDNNNLVYTLMLNNDNIAIDLTKSLVSYDCKLVQGSWNVMNYTAKGEAIETFEVDVTGFWSKDYVEVYLNNSKCEVYPCFYDMTGQGDECVVQNGYNRSIMVMFGDGVYGKQLSEGDTVTIKILVHDGATGNVSPISTPTFKFKSNLTDGFGNSVDGNDILNLTMSNYICGGCDADSYNIIRNMIGYSSRSLVIASKDNFKLFLSRFSFIGQSTIYTEPNSLYVVASCIQKYNVLVTDPVDYLELTESDIVLTDDQKNMVIESFNTSNRSFAGLNLEMEDPTIRQYAIVCYVKVDSSYSKESIKSSIKSNIASYFCNLGNNVTFIGKSDIIKNVLDNVDNIDSFDCDIISKDNEEAYVTGYWYKQELRCNNGIWKHTPIKQVYDDLNPVGLDIYGNISITENLEIPLLHGGFKYYPNKDENDTTTSLTLDAIQFHFI